MFLVERTIYLLKLHRASSHPVVEKENKKRRGKKRRRKVSVRKKDD
jgi:hypothetical protein